MPEYMVAAFQKSDILGPNDWHSFEVGWRTFVDQNIENNNMHALFVASNLSDFDRLGWYCGFIAATQHFTIVPTGPVDHYEHYWPHFAYADYLRQMARWDRPSASYDIWLASEIAAAA